MISYAFLLAASAATPAFKPAEQRKNFGVPLTSFFCHVDKPDALGAEWASVEIELNDKGNLFGLNRRVTKGTVSSPQIDDRIVEYVDVVDAGRGATVFFRPAANYGIQFEMKIVFPVKPETTIKPKDITGVLSRTDGSARRDCMTVPNFSPIGSSK